MPRVPLESVAKEEGVKKEKDGTGTVHIHPRVGGTLVKERRPRCWVRCDLRVGWGGRVHRRERREEE